MATGNEKPARPPRCIGKRGSLVKIGTAQATIWKPCRRLARVELFVDRAFFEKGAEGFIRVKLCSECAKPFEVKEG
jgi:hypothetical protein